MKRRFSAQLLYELRNFIPVDKLIEEKLKIPSKISEGVFRFLCPICNEFQTATNRKTNLARCFRCERNFNTIELVMDVRGADFVPSVKFLIPLLKKYAGNGVEKPRLEDRRGQLARMLQRIGSANHSG